MSSPSAHSGSQPALEATLDRVVRSELSVVCMLGGSLLDIRDQLVWPVVVTSMGAKEKLESHETEHTS